MPLPLPNLDNRTWQDLVDEGLSIIPRHAPGWTDHNISDPGVTLLELFAWLSEAAIFRLNQIPERHRWKFLKLIGFTPHTARPARTLLAFSPTEEMPAFNVPAGIVFSGLAADQTQVGFETRWAAMISAIGLSTLLVDAGDELLEDLSDTWRAGQPVEPFGRDPRPGSAFYLGFRQPPAGPLTLAFVTGEEAGEEETRERLRAEEAARQSECRWPVPDYPCEEEAEENDSHPPEETALLLHHSARLVWEAFTAGGWQALTALTTGARPEPGQVMDDTRALTLDGIVELWLPEGLQQQALADHDPLFYLRCRLVKGAYDRPPRLTGLFANAVFARQATRVFGRFPFAAGADLPTEPLAVGTLAPFHVELNAGGEITRLAPVDPASPGDAPSLLVAGYVPPAGLLAGEIVLDVALPDRGSGWPGQKIYLPHAPVISDDLAVYGLSEDLWQPWSRSVDLDSAQRVDAWYTLDSETGELSFGDGERGRVLPEGAPVLVRFRATHAGEGNLPAHAVRKPGDDPMTWVWLSGLDEPVRAALPRMVTNPIPAAGGRPAERLDETAARALDILHAHERLLAMAQESRVRTLDELPAARVRSLPAPTRGVNLFDLERLTLDVPGTYVARARALPAYHPAYPGLSASGVVTVVILPYLPLGRPVPSPGLIATVQRYLERRRMVGSAVMVTGPDYTEVRVHAQVRLKPFAHPARTLEAVRAALDRFLDPLSGGPDRIGWPFGRSVYRSEVLQIMDSVPGVDHVLALELKAGETEGQCGNLSVCPNGLVFAGPHELKVVR